MHQKLAPPSPECQALVTEWARQVNSGEFQACYWDWYCNSLLIRTAPSFNPINDYYFEPSQRHPHYAIFKEWETLKLSGALGKKEYELRWINSNSRNTANWQLTSAPYWEVINSYEIKKTAKHPDNQTPEQKQKLKMLDWANVPIGTMTDKGEIRTITVWAAQFVAYVETLQQLAMRYCNELQIVPATRWTAVQDGEQPPVCAGLVIEYRYANVVYDGAPWRTKLVTLVHATGLINAYRVIGIADGYTDFLESVEAQG